MRLINAENITIKLPATLSGKQLTQAFIMVKESLDELPTVEAIPIEWLERFVSEKGYDTYWAWFTSKLIDAWREEHGDEKGTDEP